MNKEAPLQDDDAQLAAMGHRPELKRQFSTWYELNLGSLTDWRLHANSISGLCWDLLLPC